MDQPSPSIRRGDVFWISEADANPQPPSADEPNYAHPYVVVQEDVFNQSRIATVIVCALTSNLNKASEPGNVRLEPGEAHLPKPSVVVVSQIASVDKARLGARIGSVSQARVDQIVAGLKFLQRSYLNR